MLAKTPIQDLYLPAAELPCTQLQYDILIDVRNDLASGRVKHQYSLGDAENDDGQPLYAPHSSFFNMIRWSSVTPCGTAHCIGGFMWARGAFLSRYVGAPCSFRPLFCPPLLEDWNSLTPAQAVRSIDFWLCGHQENCWSLALAQEA